MATISNLNESLSPQLLNDISIEIGIDKAVLEKDFYATQMISLVQEHNVHCNDFKAIFSGGTSLSKGFNIINRFSEDCDFLISYIDEPSGKVRKSYRNQLISAIQPEVFSINSSDIVRADNSKFFKIPVEYPRSHEHTNLRPYLQLEMSFANPVLEPVIRPIQSIISKVLGSSPETSIPCVQPIEIAAEKLSALTWRILLRDAPKPKYDPTLIRHLHDLAALVPAISENEETFVELSINVFEADRLKKRGGELIRDLSSTDRIKHALNLLHADKRFEQEYKDFVMSMSFDSDDKRISFYTARTVFEKICSKVSV